MPKLFDDVRHQLDLLPVSLSFHKQNFKISVNPITTGRRVYQFSFVAKDLTRQMLFGGPEGDEIWQSEQQEVSHDQQQPEASSDKIYSSWYGKIFRAETTAPPQA